MDYINTDGKQTNFNVKDNIDSLSTKIAFVNTVAQEFVDKDCPYAEEKLLFDTNLLFTFTDFQADYTIDELYKIIKTIDFSFVNYDELFCAYNKKIDYLIKNKTQKSVVDDGIIKFLDKATGLLNVYSKPSNMKKIVNIITKELSNMGFDKSFVTNIKNETTKRNKVIDFDKDNK